MQTLRWKAGKTCFGVGRFRGAAFHSRPALHRRGARFAPFVGVPEKEGKKGSSRQPYR